MLFSSITFVFLFLPISLAGYFIASRLFGQSARLGWLAACSIFFYGYWRLDYVPLLLGSVIFNHAIGRAVQSKIERGKASKRFAFAMLLIGIMFNLGLLGYFKYFDFAIETVNTLTGSSIGTLDLVLPLAISFFTFQQIAYLVDSYKGIVARNSFLNYFVFVTFFPQLIAGPIVHHKEMIPQFVRRTMGTLSWKNLLVGGLIFSIGLFKKIGIADHFGVYADLGYSNHEQLTFWDAWIATLSYTFQLYFDFSGYSDMAIGAARMFGIRLPINFFSPYKALSIQEFWRRWHMTLSRFLRDYVFIPLGGSHGSEGRITANLMTTFLLGGLWHGAGWTFVIWGGIHGAALVIGRGFAKTGFHLPLVAKWALTFAVVHLGWVFFRADNVPQAIDILTTLSSVKTEALFSREIEVFSSDKQAVQELLVVLLGVLVLPNSIQFSRDIRAFWKTVFAAVLFGVACTMMVASRSQVFLYFNF